MLLMYGGIGLFGAAVFFIARTFFIEEEKFQVEDNLADSSVNEKKDFRKRVGSLYLYSLPFVKRYFLSPVKSMKNKEKIRERYKRKLSTAGLQKYISVEEFYAYKIFLILGTPVVLIFANYLGELGYQNFDIMFMGAIGFFIPDIWLNMKAKSRQENVLKNFPFVIDMLALSVEAGLDFVAAMSKVITKTPPGAITEEFELMIKEIKIGSSRSEALRALAFRVDMVTVSSFCATLIAADSVGASIGPILKALSRELREKRSAAAEKAGAQAATKILIPMLFFIMPAIMLVLFAPVVVEWVSGGGF